MPDSNFVYESGNPIFVGQHGDHDFVYASGEPVTDNGESTLVFESGSGLGGVTPAVYEDFEDQADSIWGQDGKIQSSLSTPDGTYYRESTNSFDTGSFSAGSYSTFSWWQRVEFNDADGYYLTFADPSGLTFDQPFGVEGSGTDIVYWGTTTVVYSNTYANEWMLIELSNIDYSAHDYTGTVWDSSGTQVSQDTGIPFSTSDPTSVENLIMETGRNVSETVQIDLIQSAPANPP